MYLAIKMHYGKTTCKTPSTYSPENYGINELYVIVCPLADFKL